MAVVTAQQIDRVRAFNRDYTRRIGVLSENLLGSPYSLTEVRLMYEIAHRPGVTASELGRELGLDRGYLSRILKRFEARRLLLREASSQDARRRPMSLSALGRKTFAPLEQRSRGQIRGMLAALDAHGRRSVLQGIQAIQSAFATPGASHTDLLLRTHRPGDVGWVIARHGSLYAQEYGWNAEFEALVAEICAAFIRRFDAARERCWIAECYGEPAGSIFLVADEQDRQLARLRLLLVEPEARGHGVGGALIAACISFARECGYRRISLWTQRNLQAARRLYQLAGFERIAEQPHHSFGHDLIGETWQLDLQ